MSDPGSGLPRAEATKRRSEHLEQLERAHTHLDKLEAQWESGEPETVQERAFAEQLRRLIFGQASEQLASGEQKAMIRESQESMARRERERETARKTSRLRERRTSPPDPMATSILAAVAASEELKDAVGWKLRPVEGQPGVQAAIALNAGDIGVLALTLGLLSETNPARFSGWASSPRWPESEQSLVHVAHLRESLMALRDFAFLSLQVVGDSCEVGYGQRTCEIAERFGIRV
jgi:hypothetical protein